VLSLQDAQRSLQLSGLFDALTSCACARKEFLHFYGNTLEWDNAKVRERCRTSCCELALGCGQPLHSEIPALPPIKPCPDRGCGDGVALAASVFSVKCFIWIGAHARYGQGMVRSLTSVASVHRWIISQSVPLVSMVRNGRCQCTTAV
jgi:hypothetical protein